MELRSGNEMSPRAVAFALGLSALLATLLALALASEAPAKARAKAPVVTSVHPAQVTIGERLTIRGRHFQRGKGRNTVVFKRDGARAVFVKADIATSKMLRVTASSHLHDFLAVSNGTPQFTRFRVRVLSKRLGRRFTSLDASPLIGPADGDCDGDGTLNSVETDDDDDLLPDADELSLKTDTCKLDSDGDGVGDGYEFQSALHLNNDEYQEPNKSLPYPGKRPYPNALFADAQIDFDGDGLNLGEEHKLWRETGDPAAGLETVNYSDGLQYSFYERYDGDRRRGTKLATNYDKHEDFLTWARESGHLKVMVGGVQRLDIRDMNRDRDPDPYDMKDSGDTFEYLYYDLDGNGLLSDDERDEDADGLTNYDESHGRLTPAYWTGCYSMEGAYPVPYAGTDLTDPDSDGDKIRDGADDQDHDDIPNLMEMSRNAASGRSYPNECDQTGATPSSSPEQGWVNPFNPCLPDTASRTCTRHPSLGAAYAPFGAGIPRYLVLN